MRCPEQLLPPGRQRPRPRASGPIDLRPRQARVALLDRFGFKDRNGDGYRETPDGQAAHRRARHRCPNPGYREMDTQWKKNYGSDRHPDAGPAANVSPSF
jgi:hypothetical protein